MEKNILQTIKYFFSSPDFSSVLQTHRSVYMTSLLEVPKTSETQHVRIEITIFPQIRLSFSVPHTSVSIAIHPLGLPEIPSFLTPSSPSIPIHSTLPYQNPFPRPPISLPKSVHFPHLSPSPCAHPSPLELLTTNTNHDL